MRALIVVALAIACSPAWADEPWKEYSSKDGGFTVLLPGTPNIQKMTQKAGDGSDVKIVAYRPPPAGNIRVIVSTSDFAEQYLKVSPDKILDNARDASVSNSKGTLVREKKIKLGENPGREIVVKFPKDQGYLRARAILVGSRQYSLLYAGKDEKDVTSKEAEAFFASFKLTKEKR
jgi:hypothetical protein